MPNLVTLSTDIFFKVGSRPFIIPNDTDVYCVGCFEEKFATKCTKCKKVMNNGGVTFKNEVVCQFTMKIIAWNLDIPANIERQRALDATLISG